MEFRLLGAVEIQGAGGESIRLKRRMERLALAVLLLQAGRVVSADRLVDLLWRDAPPAGARGAVQSLVSRIRGALRDTGGEAQLLSQGQGYVLRVHPDTVDVHRFTGLVARARAVDDARQRSALLGAALDLWRGPALADAAAGSVREELCGGLEEARFAAYCDRIDADLVAGRHAELVPELSKLVTEFPLRERLHGQLMLALYRCGRRGDALDAYQKARKLLVAELGLEPGPQLRDLATAVLTDAVAAHPQAAHPAAARPAQLPPDLVGFVGRADHLCRLDGATATVRVIAGTAGVGKTSLAVHWAHRVRHRFPDGQLYVNLNGFGPSGPPMAPDQAIRGLLDALGVPAGKIPHDLPAQTALYRSVLADQRVLILLDNAYDSDQVRPLLPGSPRCLVMVTSRNTMSGLVATDAALPVRLDMLSTQEARELLAHRLGAIDDSAADERAADEVIARCAHLPLALAIVAARVATSPGLTLPALAAELSELSGLSNLSKVSYLDALDGEDATTRVRTVFSSSYRSLSPIAARLFRLFGGRHCGPSASAAALASLAGLPCPDVGAPLAELSAANLVVEPASGRYACHDLLSAYARETVEDDPAAVRRMLDHYLHTAYQAALLLEPRREPIPLGAPAGGVTIVALSDPAQAMAWFAAEHAVLFAAIPYAAAQRLDTHAWQLAWTLTTYCNRQGHWDRVIATLAGLRDSGEPHVHRLLGLAYAHLGRQGKAESHLWRALDLTRDPVDQANVLNNLAWVMARQGRTEAALKHVEWGLDRYRAAGHRAGEARLLNAVGFFQTQLGRHQSAIRHCRRALAMLEELDDRVGQANTWDSIGYIHHQLGEYPEAAACYGRALDLFREDGDRFHEADTLTHLGDTQHAAGDGERARDTWRQALAIFDDLGHADADQLRTRLDEAAGRAV
ncbi:BTAD domain-containing putative transcriptional regulator [Actinomycetes bacterium KLBMP 9797]